MYQKDYWQSTAAKDFGYTDYLADEERYVRTFHLRARLVEKHVTPPARLLEVGCAAGFGLRAFRERGFGDFSTSPKIIYMSVSAAFAAKRSTIGPGTGSA